MLRKDFWWISAPRWRSGTRGSARPGSTRAAARSAAGSRGRAASPPRRPRATGAKALRAQLFRRRDQRGAWEPVAALLRVLGATAAGEGRALVVAAVGGAVPQAICNDIGFAAAEAVAVFGAAAPAAVSRAEPAVEVLGRAAPAPSARSLAHPAAEEDAEPSPTNARLLLGGGAGAPIISAPVPRRSHHVLRNSRALDAAAVGGRAGAGLRRRRDL